MKKIILLLYIALLLLLAAATFVEQGWGSAFVEKHVYHTLAFCCLWGVLAVLSAAVLVRRRLWRQLPTLLLHGSFLVILAGAMTTFLWGKKGYVHLVAGQSTDSFMEQPGGRLLRLPFTLRLDSFRVEYYPGTQAPADYVSYIRVSAGKEEASVASGEACRISMNRILSRSGYRFYQSSFDDDRQGSWLSVNYDPWGIGITYAGYLLLGLSMCCMLVARGGGFRRLLRHPLLRKGGGLLLLAFLLSAGSLPVRAHTLPALSRRQADSLARKQVIYQDRVVPFNTLARDFVRKLTGKPAYRGLTAEQVLGGWLLRPEVWREEPMIRIKSAELRALLHLESPYARLSDLFDGQTYRLQALWKGEPGGSQKLSPLDKAIVETDEKVGLILMLQNGTLIRPLPEDGSVKPLSEARIHAELLYNRIPFAKLLFISCLTLGLLAFARLLHRMMYAAASPSLRFVDGFLVAALHAAFLFQLSGYVLRWYIGGRIPLSNGYETMQFMALAALLFACLLRRRFPFVLPFGFLLSGFALLVAYLGQMNPQITPLMPVLVSPWLSAHVSLIMMSYALYAFMMLDGVLALCLPRHAGMLMLFSRLLLYPATFFLGAGIFLGAVWANVSWGRYWAWDPKEVWALITFMVYGIAFHERSLPLFRRARFFHLYMVFAFLTVLMTYFGVNYLLGGMHSYANG